MTDSGDAPYPELKKTHTIARRGRPWTDYKPPPAAPVWAVIEGYGRYHTLVTALDLGVFDTLEDGHMTTIDEAALWTEAQRRGEQIVARSGLPDRAKFPIR